MPPFLHRSYTVIALRRLLARGSQCHKSSSSSSPTSPTLSMRESLALLFSNHYFPPTTHAVAYGSAVFPQLLLSCGKPKDMGHHHDNNHQHQITDGVSNNIDADNKDKMVDLFLVVDDPLQWHTQNMHMNPHHYSFFFRTLNGLMHSASAVRWMQTRFSPYVYFNTDVRVGGVRLKYGVISKEDAIADLVSWNSFYFAGRLQKPVEDLVVDSSLSAANTQNRLSAVCVAILLLNERFTEKELYSRITSLSYMGDVRMGMAEDPKKIQKIVDGSLSAFRAVYRPLLQQLLEREYVLREQDQAGEYVLETMNSQDARTYLVGNIPSGLGICMKTLKSGPALQYAISKSIKRLVKRESVQQAVKGLFTAGITRSVRYVVRKIRKRFS